MTSDFRDGYPFHFERTPDWRFRRALYRREHRRRAKQGTDDVWCRWAYQFLTSRIPAQLRRILLDAYTIWKLNLQTRWLLEAQLLTDRTLKEIAVVCHLPKAVVVTYERLFFDVRSRLRARDWIARHVIRLALRDTTGSQPAGLWKYMAYTGGRHILDAVVAVSLGRPIPQPSDGIPRSERDELVLRLKIQLSCTQLLAQSAEECVRILRRRDRLLRATQAPEASAATNGLATGLEVLKLSAKSQPHKLDDQTREEKAKQVSRPTSSDSSLNRNTQRKQRRDSE